MRVNSHVYSCARLEKCTSGSFFLNFPCAIMGINKYLLCLIQINFGFFI